MFIGPWIKIKKQRNTKDWLDVSKNTAVSKIHNDTVAQSLGFERALVGGPSLFGVASQAIFASFGHMWYESGTYSLRFIKPVYMDEKVRVVWEEIEADNGDSRKISFHLENQAGSQVTVGWASLGDKRRKLIPPWEREPPKPVKENREDFLPHLQPGDKLHSGESYVPAYWVAAQLDTVGDKNLWHRVASPWGAPVLPPSCFLFLRTRRENRPPGAQSPIFAGQDCVIHRPIFVDQKYDVQNCVCEKSVTQRSVLFVRETEIYDGDGELAAITRSRIRHMLKALNTGQ